MEDATQILKVPVVVRDEGGEVEHNLAVGEGGTWDLAHAITAGRPGRIEIAAQQDLVALAEALEILSRALRLAAALGKLASSDDLAKAAMVKLTEKPETKQWF